MSLEPVVVAAAGVAAADTAYSRQKKEELALGALAEVCTILRKVRSQSSSGLNCEGHP